MKSFKEIFLGKSKAKEVSKNNQHASSHDHATHNHTGKKFECPMKCETEKTYDTAGNCPVCNMKLVPISDSGSHSHKDESGHAAHGHHGCC